MSSKFNSIETLNSLKNDYSLWADKVGVLPSDQTEFMDILSKKLGLVTAKIQNVISSFNSDSFSPDEVKKAARDLSGNVDPSTEYIDKSSGTVKRYIFS